MRFEVIAVDKESWLVRVLSTHETREEAMAVVERLLGAPGARSGPESFGVAPAGNYRTGDEYGQTYL